MQLGYQWSRAKRVIRYAANPMTSYLHSFQFLQRTVILLCYDHKYNFIPKYPKLITIVLKRTTSTLTSTMTNTYVAIFCRVHFSLDVITPDTKIEFTALSPFSTWRLCSRTVNKNKIFINCGSRDAKRK